MSKDTCSAPDEVSLASILNAQMYLHYLLSRVILSFFGHLPRIVVAPKISAEHRHPSSSIIPTSSIIPITVATTSTFICLGFSFTSQIQDINLLFAADDVRPTSRQRSAVLFPVLVICWASAKPNVCAKNCTVMK